MKETSVSDVAPTQVLTRLPQLTSPGRQLKLIGYWAATAVFALQMLLVATEELSLSHDIVQISVHEGYPAYLLRTMGVWKLLGFLVPRK